MGKRERLLEKKRVATEKVLQRWAQREGLLRPGEALYFTIGISAHPTVVGVVDDSPADQDDRPGLPERKRQGGVEEEWQLSIRARNAILKLPLSDRQREVVKKIFDSQRPVCEADFEGRVTFGRAFSRRLNDCFKALPPRRVAGRFTFTPLASGSRYYAIRRRVPLSG